MVSKTTQPERKKPATSDVVGTAILGAVGAFALIMGFGYGFLEEDGQVGPGFLPVITGAFILAASLTEIARMYLAHGERSTSSFMGLAETVEEEAKAAVGRTGEPDEEEVDTFGRTSSERNWAIVKVFALLFVALLLIPVIGLLLSLTAMVLAIVLWVERKPLLPGVLTTIGALAVAYSIFVLALGVPVPQGILGLI
ncbi:tripartite tricarboxylate transporter TctB family protein [Arthrobacter sp. H14]|uniref:tripartite tricarboxylate transporter TctB family protein n=1 Tax=Arthrobacter sp. H14 TaxID=1312959 RepID=UPI00047C4BA8|nr:tripartite tricarboxylate transporter TctB family protein [Arthrobacter sp. H14]